ncbi:MAG: hypothetical protein EHJ95_00130 [Methanobacteriota archaeon]|nr:MAG: hypothetical protein EHJ95_00130 [Euryarchaeota archaeon]
MFGFGASLGKSGLLSMIQSDILRLRLYNSGLSSSPFRSAADAVTHLGAVQAQDYAAATWAIGLRIRNSTETEIERAFNEGTILRTHVMRPTWHFVMPEDIRWMIELTAPRVKAQLAHYDRRLGLDEALYEKSNAAIVRGIARCHLSHAARTEGGAGGRRHRDRRAASRPYPREGRARRADLQRTPAGEAIHLCAHGGARA